jgi:hypothetical protein
MRTAKELTNQFSTRQTLSAKECTRTRTSYLARAAMCPTVLSGQAPKPLSGASKARGLDSKSAVERSQRSPGHCLRDRAPFTKKRPGYNASESIYWSQRGRHYHDGGAGGAPELTWGSYNAPQLSAPHH